MEVKIVEKHPNGKNSFKSFEDILDRNISNSKNMRPVFKRLVPVIKEAERYAFSEANPSGWPALKAQYKNWKISKGYPSTIGIRTGALKIAATDKAIVNAGRKRLTYGLNPATRGIQKGATAKQKNKRVGEYAHYFNERRPIFEYAAKYINDLTKRMIKEYIAMDKTKI